jgi:hypothetical protein
MNERLPHIIVTSQNGDKHIFTSDFKIRIEDNAVYVNKIIEGRNFPAKVFALSYLRDITFYQNGRPV